MVYGSLSWQLQVLETNSDTFFPQKVQNGYGRRTTFHTKRTHTRVLGHVKIFLTWLSVYWRNIVLVTVFITFMGK